METKVHGDRCQAGTAVLRRRYAARTLASALRRLRNAALQASTPQTRRRLVLHPLRQGARPADLEPSSLAQLRLIRTPLRDPVLAELLSSRSMAKPPTTTQHTKPTH